MRWRQRRMRKRARARRFEDVPPSIFLPGANSCELRPSPCIPILYPIACAIIAVQSGESQMLFMKRPAAKRPFRRRCTQRSVDLAGHYCPALGLPSDMISARAPVTAETRALEGRVGISDDRAKLPHKSTTMSPAGCEQQMSTLPSEGWSRGSGPYSTEPETKPLSQL